VWTRWVGELERAQERGEVSKSLDAKMLALTLNSIIVTPYLTPLVTKLITGMEPDSGDFKAKQLDLLVDLLSALAQSASSQDVDASF
jgi:hypothetical protein